MLFKEHISFQRGLDPKVTLGIGEWNAPYIFTNNGEFISFLITFLPIILEQDIPEDILSKSNGETIPWDYYNKIVKFLIKTNKTYINCGRIESNDWTHAGPEDGNWPKELRKKLIDMGYKENTNESISFQRGVDPKSSLGIGIENPRTFTTIDEFINFLIGVLPYILDGKIPDDILMTKGEFIENYYYEKIIVFLINTGKTYIGLNELKTNEWKYNGPENEIWPRHLKNKLMSMGYKSAIIESISFERGKDPKSALGIGYDHIMHKIEILNALKDLIDKFDLKNSKIKIEDEDNEIFNASFGIEYEENDNTEDNYTTFYIMYSSAEHKFTCGHWGEYGEDWEVCDTIQECIEELDQTVTSDIKYHS